ncbi:MAG: monomethylamine corrinoid protein [Methanolobus sp.]|nr:monomethylamine corrinoid protein [Methanolobus sp.]
MSNQEMLDTLRDTVVTQNINGCAEATQAALDAGLSAVEIINDGLSPGMKIVGDKFEAAEIYLPQIMMSAKAMNAAMELLLPVLEEEKGDTEGVGTAITYVQEGDIHDIGHRLVTTMLEANGFKIVDMGVDVPNEKVAETVAQNKDKKLLLVGSALMTTSMLGIGADATAENAADAARVALSLMQ